VARKSRGSIVFRTGNQSNCSRKPNSKATYKKNAYCSTVVVLKNIKNNIPNIKRHAPSVSVKKIESADSDSRLVYFLKAAFIHTVE
jgi:flagellar basal body rod protein FlgC